MKTKVAFVETAVKEINSTPYMVYLAVTGGGQSFIQEYMQYSGASKTIAGAIVPYNQHILQKFINKTPRKYCSEQTAANLAVASYNECRMAVAEEFAIGIGVTCTIATDGERIGREHNVYIAAHTKEFSASNHIALPGLSRSDEENIIKDLIFQWLYALSVKRKIDFDCRTVHVKDLMDQHNDFILKQKTLVVYPGSFNPWHHGHERVYNIAQIQLGIQPILEITISNVDKGVVDFITLENRLATIPDNIPYIITDAPTFHEKVHYICQLYRNIQNIIFLVGADTWNRIWTPEVYIPNIYDAFANNNVKFIVFPRTGFTITTGIMDSLIIHGNISKEIEIDISSTEIRDSLDPYHSIDLG